ncbi:DNA helicase RecG, partial [Streptococcus suis]|nr:DNA helicase RecG [Streptococcus suis]
TAIDQGYMHLLEENLPSVLRERYRLMNRREAVYAMHFPTNLEEYRKALRRMKFEELFYFQLQLKMLKANHRDILNG